IPGETRVLLFAALALAIAGSLHVLRLGVRADELQLIQRLAQAIAAELTLSHSFQRVQELTRQLVPWEQMGFARYDARTRQMELVADTAAQAGSTFRFDADAGLTGEALRLRRPLVAHGLARDQVVVPGGETPGSEMLVPLYHAGQLVGLWSVRHSDPSMYRQSDGDLLELLAPQLALMVAIDGSLRPVTGASDQTMQYVQTLTATTEAARAGIHGRGFAVVADEVHKLAEASGREARNVGKAVQDTRRALDRAAQLIERIRGDLGQLVQGSAAWVQDLDRIAEAAAETARAGKQVAEVGRQNAELAAR